MKQNIIFKTVCMGCILAFLSGCGTNPSQLPPSAEQSSDNTRTDAGYEGQKYITIAEAKAAVLENAGLSEENVSFVRLSLDSESGSAIYEIEFISADTEYDYDVDAVTGGILSLTCENGSYDIDKIPEEVTQATDEIAQAAQQPVDGNLPAQQYIGVDAAKIIALEHADLPADDVRFVHAHLDFDDGCWQYDIEFHKDGAEYDYNIDALSGEVISCDHDTEYHHHHGTGNSSGSAQITEDKATQIALEYAGISETEAQYLTVEFDYDDGRAEYQVEWYVGRMEYSCDVDASTGDVLSFEKEYD